MRKEEQPVLSDFIEKDQFELNSYLTSLLETTSEKKENQSWWIENIKNYFPYGK